MRLLAICAAALVTLLLSGSTDIGRWTALLAAFLGGTVLMLRRQPAASKSPEREGLYPECLFVASVIAAMGSPSNARFVCWRADA